jgi:hypothetical protein
MLVGVLRKAATTGFTHAAISPGPLIRITISTGLLLTAAVSSRAPLLQLDQLMTASSSSSATVPFSGPPSPTTLWFTNSEAEAMSNQTLFLGVMHAPFLMQKSNLTV